MAAAFAAGATSYDLTWTSHANPGRLATAISVPLRLGSVIRAVADAATKTHPGSHAGDLAARPARSRVSARPQVSARPRVSAASSARPARSATAAATPTANPAPSAVAAPSASASASPSQTITTDTFTCADDSYLLPENVTAIVNFLVANGYSDNAAAGIAGNIYQESGGDPESAGMGGGGLIGWTPLPSGFVTGNPAADLQTQLNAILTFNQGSASYIPALNAADTPADAAYIYVTDFERAGIPAAATREASAEAVAAACGL